MRRDLEDLVIEEAKYIRAGFTVREVAKLFSVSKTTVHNDMRKRLPKINYHLYTQVDKSLEKNKKESTMRGGMATARKYKKEGDCH